MTRKNIAGSRMNETLQKNAKHQK